MQLKNAIEKMHAKQSEMNRAFEMHGEQISEDVDAWRYMDEWSSQINAAICALEWINGGMEPSFASESIEDVLSDIGIEQENR